MKSYVNSIIQEEVSMALQHLCIAPYGTSYDKTRIDVSSPPAGFLHLGAVVNDSPAVQVTKQKYQLPLGIPDVVSYEVVMSIRGEIGAVLISNSTLKSYMAGGGAPPVHYPIVAHSGSAAPVVTADTITRTVLSVNTTAGFVVGASVVTDSSGNIGSSLNVTYITSVGGGNIYLSGDGFHFIPVAGQPVMQILRDEYPLGTSRIPYWKLLGVADFLNNGQVVYEFGRATPRGQWSEALRVGTEARVPVVFDLQGYVDPVTGENIIGARYQFSANTIQ